MVAYSESFIHWTAALVQLFMQVKFTKTLLSSHLRIFTKIKGKNFCHFSFIQLNIWSFSKTFGELYLTLFYWVFFMLNIKSFEVLSCALWLPKVLGIRIRYLKGALLSDGDNMFDASESPTGRSKDYVPSTDSGSKLPHMNVRALPNLSSKVYQVRPISLHVSGPTLRTSKWVPCSRLLSFLNMD